MKIILRAAAQPLTPSHVASIMMERPGSGFHLEEAPEGPARNYRAIALQNPAETIAADHLFQKAIEGVIYAPTKKPIARMTPRNQFMAFAPHVDLAKVDSIDSIDLKGLHPAPFVISFAIVEALHAIRLSMEDPITTESRLEGFVERHLGAVGMLFGE